MDERPELELVQEDGKIRLKKPFQWVGIDEENEFGLPKPVYLVKLKNGEMKLAYFHKILTLVQWQLKDDPKVYLNWNDVTEWHFKFIELFGNDQPKESPRPQ